ncbi:MAG TPA: DUF6134 family protein [Chitinophagaceae bacterium]|nr:DUF6134 family protein [Chitinophagaceae bacterium]
MVTTKIYLMIPALIIWLLRRYRHRHMLQQAIDFKQLKRPLPSIVGLALLALAMLITLTSHAQSRQFNYQIVRNGSKVGTLNFSETTNGVTDYLKMESDVKTRFIFTFTAHASEEAVYRNGILLNSSIYRKLNGNEKVNKQHLAQNSQYIIRKGNNTEINRNYPITYSMLSMYCKEPQNISKVYSDNFETFLPIQKIDGHKYKITLRDGNYNYYCYKDGVLNRVEIHHTLYSANIVLTNN